MTRNRGIIAIVIAVVVIAVIAISVLAIRTTYPSASDSTNLASDSAATTASMQPSEPTASPSPTVDPVIAWADAVCGASFDIRDTVSAVGEDLVVVPRQGALEEIKGRLKQRAALVAEQLTPLTVALGQVPIDIPEAMALANTLNSQVTELQTSADRTRASIDALTASDGIVAFGLALPEAVDATTQTAGAVKALVSTVSTTASATGDRLTPGFRDSVQCQALTAGQPRPASS